MKKFFCIATASLMIMGSLSLPMASFADSGEFVENHSVSFQGKLVEEEGRRINPLFQEDIDNRPSTGQERYGSFIVYGDPVSNSPDTSYNGYDYKYKEFWNTSIEIPAGLKATYEWEQNVEREASMSTSISSTISGSVGNDFIGEIETSIEGSFETSVTKKVSAGQKSSVEASSPGFYEATWYLKGKRYSIYVPWEAWTRDQPNTMKIVDRYVGSFTEPTEYLHLEVK